MNEYVYYTEYKVNIGGTVSAGSVTGGIWIKVYVQFVLPENVYVAEYSGSGNLSINLANLNLQQNNTNVDLANISKITVGTSTDDIYDEDTKQITLSSTVIGGTLPAQKKLTISLKDGSSITYYLVIKQST